MVLGVAVGSLTAALIGAYLAITRGHSLLAVPTDMWPLLLADCLGIGLYGITSALATSYLPGAEVAFLLLIDVIVAPLLVCMVHGEIPTAAGSSGAALLAAAVIGHEFAALKDIRERRVPTPPTVAASRAKVRVSDANLHGVLPSADDRSSRNSRGGTSTDGAVEIEMAVETDTLLNASDDGSAAQASPQESPRRPGWLS